MRVLFGEKGELTLSRLHSGSFADRVKLKGEIV